MASEQSNEAYEKIIKANKLQVADIVVCHHKHSLLSSLIMYGTKSFWSHAALMFVIRDEGGGFDNSFVIESVRAGISITNLNDYFSDPQHYDVGIKRLEKPWFANPDQGLAIRKTVRGHMLDFIKDKYDFGMILDIAAMVIASLVFGTRVALFGLEHEIRRASRKKTHKQRLVPSRFICSGFVQYSLYTTVRDLVRAKQLTMDDLKLVNFNPTLQSYPDLLNLPQDSLLATTPDDIARAESLTWKYLVKDGRVYEVRSQAEVERITSGG
jgi:hypothetical protein